jgi:RimJ/RimL family protein N-acetyltransferase
MRRLADAVEFEVVRYDEEFRKCSAVWLRDAETARLTRTPPFSDDEQRAWFEGLDGRTDYAIWGVRLGGSPVGAFGLKHITNERAEYWGYLGPKHLWGQGYGAHLVRGGIDAAVARGIGELYLHVGLDNVRAMRLYHRHGFAERWRDEEVARMVRQL